MIKINNKTQRENLLNNLVTEAETSVHNLALKIYVTSLPSFLNSEISFKVFHRQIINYPREIIWLSSSEAIVNFLKNLGVQTKILPTKQNTPKTPANLSLNLKNFDNANKDRSRVKLKIKSDILETKENQPQNQQPDNLNSLLSRLQTTKANLKNIVDKIEASKPGSQSSQQISQISPKKESANPIKKSDQQTDDTQKDIRINNIHINKVNSKNNKIVDNAANHKNPDITSKIIFKEGKTPKKLEKKTLVEDPKGLVITKITHVLKHAVYSLIFLAFILSLTAIWFFPTTVYTIKLDNKLEEKQVQIEFRAKDFKKLESSFRLSSESQTTGQKQNIKDFSRAFGQVVLTNKSAQDINLTSGKFYIDLPSKGLRYRHSPKLEDSEILTIPAFTSEHNGPKVDVFAIRPGEDYSLEAGQTLQIRNNNGASLGKNAKAKTTSKISLQTPETSSFVTQSDYDNLREENQEKFRATTLAEMRKLKKDKVFVDPEWYFTSKKDLNYSKKVNEFSTDLSLNTDYEVEIYYLDVDIVLAKSKLKNKEIEKITITKSQGSFEDPENIILLDFVFKNKKLIQKDKLSQDLENKNPEELEKNIKKTEDLTILEKQNSGLKIPGIKPRVEVDLV